MRLKTLEIRGFAQLRGIVDLDTGPATLALVLERNEAGKSTLAAAISAALYGLETNRTRYRGRQTPAERYRPWRGGPYGVELIVERNGRELRISRDFEQKTVEVREGAKEVTAEFRRGKETYVGELLTGLTQAQFELSAFVPQGEIVWEDPSALAEALQRVADSQGGERTAEAAIAALQSALEQYEGVTLKRGLARTEIQRCQEELASSRARMEELDRQREALDAEIDQLRGLDTAADLTRARRDALRLRRAATELDFERQALAGDDERRERRDEILARIAADPMLAKIDDEARREIERDRRRHDMLGAELREIEKGLARALEARDRGRQRLSAADLPGTPTAEQVTELGSWAHTRRELVERRDELGEAVEREREKLRHSGFDPAVAARLSERFSGLIEAERALLSGLRKQRRELEDEAERLRQRMAAARDELQEIHESQDARRRSGWIVAAVGAILGGAGAGAAVLLAAPPWATAIPGIVIAAVGLARALGAGGHRGGAAAAASSRIEDYSGELHRLDAERASLGEELGELAARLGCSVDELQESWQTWLDLQPHTSQISVLEDRLARIAIDEERLAEAVATLEPILGRVPALEELDDLYQKLREAREIADSVASAERDRAGREEEVAAKRGELEEAGRALRRRLGDLGVHGEEGSLTDLLDLFEARAEAAAELARLREGELRQLERLVSSPQQRAVRQERIAQLGAAVDSGRSRVEELLAAFGSEGEEIAASLDEPLTEDELQNRLRELERQTEQRHEDATRRLTEVRSFVERYEREAPALRDRIDELSTAERRTSEFVEAVELARDTLAELARATHGVWSRELSVHTNRALQAMGSDIGEVEFDEKLNLTLVQRGQRMSGTEAGQSLSTGARDLLHLACRLALARFLSGGGEPLPLILDDPFAHCDDQRTLAGMQVLLESVAPAHQVVLLACQRSRYTWVRQELDSADRIRPLALEDRA